ncbi:SDR family oxidoreductase [Siphonobacter curvatus]|uniref:Short-chain dehydrogenase n=1 Tax=Siphonobacter curvatus TaxID=2094562 RepID=A0A2S7IRJ2_9BACT|nr:SDR family oxidoreductase [Siphonobacter curvatus]PQA60296.1 short-chain dehydrogenase [Siphonobacter curvatus]
MHLYTQPMLTPGTLTGKTILVTGGGTGLGKSMAREFLRLGANVTICSRKQAVIEATAQELMETTGGQVLAVPCDVRQYDQIENVLSQTLERFGRLDGLVNNAAGNFISPTERLSAKAFETVIGIVLQGSVNFTLAVGKHWIQQNQPGTILSIITSYAFTGTGYTVPSAVSKAGVRILTRSLAVEWARHGIRLNNIAPGPFPTKGAWDRLVPEPVADLIKPESRVPLGRVGEHQELANLAAYLMSDYSAYITGQDFTIDGGEWLKGAGQFSALEMIPDEGWDEIEQTIRRTTGG